MTSIPLRRFLCTAATLLGVALATTTTHAALLLHYAFDQSSGTVVSDLAANPANGTLTGAGSTWTPLPAGFRADYAYSNSGASGSYVTAGDAAKLDGLTDFTITGWLNVSEANIAAFTQDRVASKRGSSGAFFDLKFDDAGNGQIGISLEISTTVGGSMSVISNPMDMSGWFFFAVSRDAQTGEIIFYYGTPEGALDAAGSGIGRAGTILDNNAAFMIGNTAANTARAPFADFSDFRIYDEVLDGAALRSIQYEAIPEPASIVLSTMSLGALALCMARRRRIQA